MGAISIIINFEYPRTPSSKSLYKLLDVNKYSS